jgi:hypothetical protein
VIDDDLLRSRIHAALDGVHQPDPGLLRRSVEAIERRRRRAPQLRALVVAALAAGAALAIVVLTLVQHQLSGGNGSVRTPAPASHRLVYTLDAAGTVTAYDERTLRPVWRASVGAPPSASDPAALLRLSADGRTLWVLPLSDRRGGTTLRSFDAAGGAPGPSIALSPQGGAAYHALAVDPRSGNLIAVGQDATRILLTLADPRRDVVLSTVAARTPAGATDVTTEARFDAGGSRLYYSYGTGDAGRSGIDWVTVQGTTLTPCTPAQPGAACIPGAGTGFTLVGSNLLVLDDLDPQHLVELSADGAPVRQFGTGLGGGAVTDPVLSADQRTALLAGGCESSGGLVRIDLSSGATQSLSTPVAGGAEPDTATPCGVRPHLLSDGSLLLSRLDTASANANTPGLLRAVDPQTGRVLRQATTPAGVVDIVEGP